MKCAAKKPVQLRLCRQTKCPTHLRLRAYLIKCLETTRRPWIKINFQRIAETFGVTERTLRSAKKRLERDNDLKFRTLSKARGSGWQVIVALEANLLWDKEPLFYKKQQEKFRSRNVKDRHCGDLIEERMANSNLATRDRGVPVYTYETIPQKRWPSLQHVPISGIRHGIRHVPIQGTWGRTSENKGFSQQYAYCLTANSSTIELLKNAANRLQPTTNGLKGRWSTVKLPGNGNGENVAEFSAFVDSLRKCAERMEDYEGHALCEQSHRGRQAAKHHNRHGRPSLQGNLLHRRPYPDPRLTDEVGTQTPAAVTQPHFVPRKGKSESLRRPNRIERPPSKQRVVGSNTWVLCTLPAVSRAAASNSPRACGENCKSAGYAQTTSLTRSPAPRTSVNRKPAKRLVVGIHRPANPPSAQNHDRQVRFPQVNDLNPQHPESQSGAQPLVIGDDQSLSESLYRERSPVGTTAVKTRSQRSRRWILAASGAELRRLATRKQIRLAYFHARSGCTWSIWDNCKVKEQPEVAKSLWLAGFLAGFDAKTIDKAFDDALHESHGMATDVGLNEGNPRLKFEMSHTVSLAKEILIRKLDKPENSKN